MRFLAFFLFAVLRENAAQEVLKQDEATSNDFLTGFPTTTLESAIFMQEDVDFIELGPLVSSDFSTGPVLIINENTFYIPNIYTARKFVFWASEGAESKSVIAIPEEILPYSGQSVYVNLPKTLTYAETSFFGAMFLDESRNFTSVALPHDVPIPKALEQEEESAKKRILRLKKCCRHAMSEMGCTDADVVLFKPELVILENNATHLNDTPMRQDEISIKTYVQDAVCMPQHVKFEFGLDEVFFLTNGSVLLNASVRLISPQDYCIDSLLHEDSTSTAAVFICTAFHKDMTKTGAIQVTFGVCTAISCLLLFVTTLLYALLKEIGIVQNEYNKLRGKIVVYFSWTMAMAFILLFLTQCIDVHGNACRIIGYSYQYFKIKGFLWLNLLTFETLYMIRRHHVEFRTTTNKKRRYIYLSISFIASLLILLIPVFSSVNPSMPSYLNMDKCVISDGSLEVLYYYVPILISIVATVALLTLAEFKIAALNRKGSGVWKLQDLKKMLTGMTRSYWIILLIMAACWSLEVFSFFYNNGIWLPMGIVESLQGAFVFIVFVWHKPIRMKFKVALTNLMNERTKDGSDQPLNNRIV